MKTINELFGKLQDFNKNIESIIKYAEYDEYDDLSGLEIDTNNEEELLLLDQLRPVMEHLSEARINIIYLSRPVKHEGYLEKGANGRYHLTGTDYEFTCGSLIEIYVFDDYRETYRWKISSVEYKNGDYYIVNCKEPMSKLLARVRA